MRRFVLIAAIWVVFVGGVAGYTHLRDAERAAFGASRHVAPERAAARYAIELTMTFDAQPDPFALLGSTGDAPPVATVRLNERVVAELREGSAPGVPWRMEDVAGVVVGSNEVFVEATPPPGVVGLNHGVRVRIFEDLLPLADETFWSDGGGKVAGVVSFAVADAKSEDAHGD